MPRWKAEEQRNASAEEKTMFMDDKGPTGASTRCRIPLYDDYDIENNIVNGKELSCTVASVKTPNAKALAGLRNQAVSGHQNVAGQSAEVLHGLVNCTAENIACASTDMPPNASAFSE